MTLVVIAALCDGRKGVLSVSSGYRESTQSWSEVLRDLKEGGMNPPRLVIADGHLGIWGALRKIFPEADQQRCWNHRIFNLLAKISKSQHQAALLRLRQIPYAETRQEAVRVKARFQHWCGKRGLEAAADLIDQDWDRMVTFYNYPKQQWQHLCLSLEVGKTGADGNLHPHRSSPDRDEMADRLADHEVPLTVQGSCAQCYMRQRLIKDESPYLTSERPNYRRLEISCRRSNPFS